jgi:preprotein translocase subunit SecE
MAQPQSQKKTGPIAFLKQVKAEGKKVTWPTRKETTLSTIMVFIMVILAAIFLFLTDQIVATIIRWILG